MGHLQKQSLCNAAFPQGDYKYTHFAYLLQIERVGSLNLQQIDA